MLGPPLEQSFGNEESAQEAPILGRGACPPLLETCVCWECVKQHVSQAVEARADGNACMYVPCVTVSASRARGRLPSFPKEILKALPLFLAE